ncbi:Hypothetical_protein [Hexamita inflata]|uniref:Hypothetical_protein n=1 Tax=Hexamita inflata TaxID=28002 RepID=A0ABP1GFM7_9EUKA
MYQLDKNIHHSQIGYLSFRLLALVLFRLSKICEVQGFQYILFKTFEYTYVLHQNNQIRTVCNYTYFKTGKQQFASFKIQSFTKDIKSCIILAIIDKIFNNQIKISDENLMSQLQPYNLLPFVLAM